MNVKRVLLKKLHPIFLTFFYLVDLVKCILAQVYTRAKRKVIGKRIAYEYFVNLDGLLCVITGGASTEVGLECVKRLLKRNCYVVIVEELDQNQNSLELQLAKDLRGYNNELWQLHHLDLSSFESINKFVNEFKKLNRTIDFLVNYTDAFLTPAKLKEQKLEKRIAINYLGHCLLTLNLLPYLKPSSKFRKDLNFKSRIVNVTSIDHHWIDRSKLEQLIPKDRSTQRLTYSLSRLLTIAFSFYLSNEMLAKLNKSEDVLIVNVHPGITAANLLDTNPNQNYLLFALKKFLYNLLLFTPEQATDHILHSLFSTELIYRENIYVEFFELSKLTGAYTDVSFQKKVFNKTINLLKDYLEKDEFITRL